MNRIATHFADNSPIYLISAAVLCMFVGVVGVALAHNLIAHPWFTL